MSIAAKVKSLGLPAGGYVVVGSGVMDALGIRRASDIDIVVRPDVFDALRQQGWQAHGGDSDHPIMQRDQFEVGTIWESPWGGLTLADLQKDSVVIDDVWFVGLPLLLAWKKSVGRAKDLHDAALIESHVSGQPVVGDPA